VSSKIAITNKSPDEIAQAELIEEMAGYEHDPLGWVQFSFPWGEKDTELEKYSGPDIWQAEVLDYVGQQLRAGAIDAQGAVSHVIRVAVASGNGPGKSALVAWIILWALSTKEDTRGVVTANTESQLKIKTWAELAKWYRLCIIKHWFELTATSIYSKDPEHRQTWRIDQVPWSEHKTEAFAGLHNKGRRIILIFDEASAVPDTIWEVAEGALTDKDTEILWFVFGNPTRNSGRFRECWGKLRHRWKQWQLDIRKSVLVNLEEVKQWISDYGIDSDWVRVHVLGIFPKSSTLQFIPSDLVEAARGKQIRQDQFNFAPKIISCDPAWTGGDTTEIGIRQGLVWRHLQTFQKNDDDSVIAAAIAKWEDHEKADAVFIDKGYGTGIYSFGKTMNREWMLVDFGSKSTKAGFANKRAEMWGDILQWLKEGGCIPNDQQLVDDLIGPEVIPTLTGTILLEPKHIMKKRGLASPNKGDCLGISFAFPVLKKKTYPVATTDQNKVYDPYKDEPKPHSSTRPYNPLD